MKPFFVHNKPEEESECVFFSLFLSLTLLARIGLHEEFVGGKKYEWSKVATDPPQPSYYWGPSERRRVTNLPDPITPARPGTNLLGLL